MKIGLSLFVMLIVENCIAQNILIKADTLFKKERVTLLLDNGGFAIPPFAVSGEFYLTNNTFIFHCRSFRRKRYEMYNDLIKDIIIPYEDISQVRRSGIDGLKIKTKIKKYKFGGLHMKPRTTIALINHLIKEHSAK